MLRIYFFIDKAVEVAGPLYIALAVSLISCIIYLFFTVILPSIHSLNSLKGVIHIIISIWLIFNVFFNYYYCVKTDPGSPTDFMDVEQDPMTLINREDDSVSKGLVVRWCKSCQKLKPPMTHHCHICKRCILRMDHHCPWMHNCVGFFNYRFFLLFLVYMWVGSGYTAYMAFIPLQTSDDEDDIAHVLFTFVLSLAVFFSIMGLFWFHVYLVLSAQTSIDFAAYRRRRRQARIEARQKGEKTVMPPSTNNYDLGKIRNLRNIFDRGGAFWWLVMFLPHTFPPKGDGMHFINRHSKDSHSPLDRVSHVSDESGGLENTNFHLVPKSSQDIR